MNRTLLFQVTLLASLSLNGQSLTVDQSFGTDGTVFQSEPAWTSSARPIELITLANGKLLGFLVAGQYEVLVERFLTNGDPDSTFAAGGVFTSQVSSDQTFPVAMIVRPNGKIVVVAQKNTPNALREAVLIQLLENGSLDPSFGDNGMIRHGLTGTFWLNDAKLQEDGKLIVVGGANSMMALRYTREGQVDNSFGENGIGLFSDGGNCRATSLDIAANGDIFLGGYRSSGLNALAWILMKLTPNGQKDTTFAENGALTLDQIPDTNYWTYRQEAVSDIHIEADGSVIVAGRLAFVANREQFAVRRISATGSIIDTFGDNGLLLVGAPVQRSVSKRLIFDPTGQYILCGVDFQNNSGYRLLILRFDMNGNVIDPSPDNSVFSYQPPAHPSPDCAGTLDHLGRLIVMTGYYSKPNGRSSLTAFQMNIVTSVMDETDLERANFNIWPNPTTGHITFEAQKNLARFTSIEVLDATGRLAGSTEYGTSMNAGLRNGNLELASDLKNGNYFIRFTSPDRVITKQIILSR